MRRFARVCGLVPRKGIAWLLATVVGFVLLPCGVAAAQATATSNFDSFALGSIDGQHGWRSGPVGGQFGAVPFDQEVVRVDEFYPAGVPGFGTQAWRFSNLRWSTAFGNQTFSPVLSEPVTESGPKTEFIAEFSFVTARTGPQPGLFASISPDDGAAGRMSLVQLIDGAGGTEVVVWDTTAGGDFVRHEVAVLPDGVPHTIKMWMKLHPGDNNDVLAVFIDGKDVGQRFTTWENFYRHPGVNQPVPEINSLLFRASEPGFDEQDGGYLFLDESTSSGSGGGPPEPDVGDDKTASPRTVQPGGLVRYTITVRNRGRAVARNLLVCDRLPRQLTFVSADRRLLRIGRRRCLVINNLAPGRHVTFHLTARVNLNAPAGAIDNDSDETEGVEPPAPPLGPPSPPTAPGRPPAPTPDIPGHITNPKPVEGAEASVVVVRPAPAVTG